MGTCLLLPFFSGIGFAGTTGKLSGRITDSKKAPLAGVNVAVPAVRLGAVTDADGHFIVLNIPSGGYDVKVSLIGYRPMTYQGVVVSADNTTRLDVTLQIAPVAMQEVVVNAERPVVDLTRTSTMASVDRKKIQSLPVQDLADVVNLQAGVVDGHFRGGRKGEVQYQVDGVSVNNVYDNTSSLRLDRSLLEEVQVISGTFDAEYGQAMSGVVNAVLRRGTKQLRWDGEMLFGGFYYSGSDRLQTYAWRPLGTQNYQVTLSGPCYPRTTFLVSGRYYHFDDWIMGERKFKPTDVSDFEHKDYRPTGNGERVPLGYSREKSGIAKLTNRPRQSTELNYQAVFNVIEGRRGDFGSDSYRYRLEPDALSKQRTTSLTHGLDWTETMGPARYLTTSVRQNHFDYKDTAYDSLYDPRYDAAGFPIGDPNYENGAVIQGVQPTRFHQETNTYVIKSSFVNQYANDQQVKFGGEFQWPELKFGSMGYIVYEPDSTGTLHYGRHDNEPPTYPGVTTYWPRMGAVFAQEDLEWNDLRIRAGLRFEYFDGNSTLPSDLRNPANALPPPRPQSHPVPTTPKISLSPRLGVSYPVTRDAALFFAYGHFYQMPSLGQVYNNSNYDKLATLQAGTSSFGAVMGNPDIRPERTVQYQFGYKQALAEWLGLEVSMFYKDIRDLLGTELITTYNSAEYARLTNVDFGNVVGFTVMLDQRARGMFSSTVDFTWQLAQGNSSDPNETATRAEAGEDPRPRQAPFNWDQRNTLNLTGTWSRPDDFIASTIVRIASGQPYTPTIASGFGGGLETNSGRKPATFEVDLRGEKQLPSRLGRAAAFLRVFNVFDTRFANGFVFGSTGSPYYSSDPATDKNTLANPSRYSGPRRIELGVTMQGGQ